jgi:hypothetical protein
LRLDEPRALLAVIVMSLLFPILPLLERGQIDSFTLLFIALGFYLIFARRRDLLGGVTIAAAGFIKLQCFYLLPLLLLARRPRAAIGMIISIFVIASLQIFLCGWPLTRQYVVEELPRIARHGEVGTEAMRIATPAIAAPAIDAPPGDAVAGGRWRYRYTLLPDYAAMASLVPYVRGVLNAVGLRVPTPAVSIPLLLLALVFVRRFLPHGVAADDPWARLAFMLAALIIVLLTAPITWTTNLVWLAPLVPLILFAPDLSEMKRARAAAVIGCVLLIVPDALANPFLLPRLIDLTTHKRVGQLLGAHYVLALMLLLPWTLLRSGRRTSAHETN